MWSPDVPESGIQLGDVGVILKRESKARYLEVLQY